MRDAIQVFAEYPLRVILTDSLALDELVCNVPIGFLVQVSV